MVDLLSGDEGGQEEALEWRGLRKAQEFQIVFLGGWGGILDGDLGARELLLFIRIGVEEDLPAPVVFVPHFQQKGLCEWGFSVGLKD